MATDGDACDARTHDTAVLGAWDWDIATNSIRCSPGLLEVLGVEEGAGLAHFSDYVDTIEPEDRGAVEAVVSAALAEPGPFRVRHRIRRPDGVVRWIEGHGQVFCDDRGRPVRAVGTAHDITEQVETAAALERSMAHFRAVVEQGSVVVVLIEPSGNISYLSPAAEQLLGYGRGELAARARDLVHPEDFETLRSAVNGLLSAPGAHRSFEFRLLDATGSYRYIDAVGDSLVDDPAVGAVVLHCTDRTEEHRAEERAEFERLHDPLTGLANRHLFLDHVRRAIGRGRDEAAVAVIVVDLDGFKEINLTLGNLAGDDVLASVGDRLHDIVGTLNPGPAAAPVVARVGGDEFAVLCEAMSSPTAAARFAGALLEATVAELPTPEGHRLRVGARAGVALHQGESDAPESILFQAEQAADRARSGGGGQVVFFDADAADRADRHTRAVADLRRGIEQGELVLHYQPKIDISSGAVVGVEALVRWAHPERGLLPPSEFVPLAEASGLIDALGHEVLTQACAQQVRWRETGASADLLMSVNVSAQQFGTELPGVVAGILRATGSDGASLVLELTETVVMENADLAAVVIEELKALGVQVSIDDFGTGYSSLAYLRRFAVDEVKIDRAFVDGLGRESEDTAIVVAIVAMSHALGITVVGEGVETRQQLDELRAVGCELAQGYLFSRPAPAVDIGPLLQQRYAADDGRFASTRETVLVVDDTEDVRQLARVSLSAAGYGVTEAAGGAEAFAIARRLQPHCIVLDIDMPDVSGLEVCRRIRADPATADCAIIMLTANASPADRIAAFSAGADEYIVKPFVPRDLSTQVGACLRRRRAAT